MLTPWASVHPFSKQLTSLSTHRPLNFPQEIQPLATHARVGIQASHL